jgi:hypothetical protein
MSVREHQAQQYTPGYGFHGIANMRITKVVDDETQRLVAYKMFRSPGVGTSRIIWMDGRARPPEYAAHTWQGFSIGGWSGGVLVVETSHMKAGTIQRDGVPHSDRAILTEHFVRHGDYLTVVGILDDPLYLDEPLVRSWNFVVDPDQELEPVPAQIVDEIPSFTKGQVPHHLPGSNVALKEFAERFGLPFEATRGGNHTMYPEYQRRLRELMAASAATDAGRPQP